ncbi:RAMP superfamily CRISPR-associated protein [Microcoleus sp. ARI1-B5]|uniref:RAMP superfamily CRISPR-associated protein n=1 Tax=unclassified Microcoleus TaxID=2642155 RepID=UPI002FD049B8
MSPNPWERPKQSPKAQPKVSGTPNPATQKAGTDKKKKVITVGGGGGGTSGGGGGGRGPNTPDRPSPWLDPENEPHTDATASFVEYLRWMRSPDLPYKDATKVQILQLAEEKANYRDRLTQLTNRTKLIAGEKNYFSVQCPWRIRTGGHRGPESILLPAFDALGMPFIPSSTLRGVARNQAIREIMAKDKVDWKEAEELVAPWFGSLKAQGGDRAGKVVFLDAYPSPSQKAGGLAVDMANNIWTWEGNSLKYSPNPNPFFSLKEATFVIGLRLGSGCNDITVLQRVKEWLIRGLQAGIGSQVNTGYGEILVAGQGRPADEFFRVQFSLEGQLIHGRQKFTNVRPPYQKNRDGSFKTDNKGNLKPETTPEAEVRPVAFKSMLRYWFRTLAMGVLPPERVCGLEAILFGAINPQREWGWIKFTVIDRVHPKPKSGQDTINEQNGELVLAYSHLMPSSQKETITDLMKNLTWLMFHLGGIGQGARRPCYSRQNRPYLRGSTLIPNESGDFWILPSTPEEFQQRFRACLRDFYTALNNLQSFYAAQKQLTAIIVNANAPRNINPLSSHQWAEAVDANCRIVVTCGEDSETKCYALDILHQHFHKLENEGKYREAKSLCGGVKEDILRVNGEEVKRKVTPSPVWIADLGDYQIVTVFGATQNPRQKYLANLQEQTTKQNFVQLWPF